MRNLSKLVFQRVVAVSVGILLQIGFLIVMATYLRADFFWIRIAMNVLSWAMVIYIISCGVNPSYKIAWIVLILAFPVAGLTIYLLFGGNKISSYEHRKMQSIEAVTMQQLQQEEEPLWELAAARTPAFNHARYLLSASGYPIYDDADATYFPSGESCYAAMLEELQKAEHYIFIEFFIIAQGKMWDPILQLLREKAAAGVDVRVVYDDFGCITRLPMRYAKKLREMGIRAHAFNPYVPILSARLNNRDHRKLMIIDGRAAFTGGVNLADEYINELERFGRWKDCGILVRGKAVWSMTVMFLSLWGYVDRCEEDVSRFRVACDVTNPLCGEKGASAVFGPQKGARPADIPRMDAWLAAYAQIAAKAFPGADPEAPGTGAAGGLGFAFRTFLSGELEPGVQIVLEETRLAEALAGADVVVTGEGRLDGQTAMGKAPVGVARLAKARGCLVIALAGGVTRDAGACNGAGIDAFFPAVRGVTTLAEAMDPENARANLADAAEQAFRLLAAARA